VQSLTGKALTLIFNGRFLHPKHVVFQQNRRTAVVRCAGHELAQCGQGRNRSRGIGAFGMCCAQIEARLFCELTDLLDD
jgi:hypothetical protein